MSNATFACMRRIGSPSTEYMETKWKTLLSCCFSRFSPERREFARSNKNSTFFLLFHFFNVVVCGVFEESIFRWCGPRKTVLDEMLVAFACTLSPTIRFNRLRMLNVGCFQEQTHCVNVCVRAFECIPLFLPTSLGFQLETILWLWDPNNDRQHLCDETLIERSSKVTYSLRSVSVCVLRTKSAHQMVEMGNSS